MLPPTLEARQKIVDAMEIVGPYFNSFAVVLVGMNARINQPILEGLMLLARPRFPLRFFSSVMAAAEWLCRTTARGCAGPLAPAKLAAAAEDMRRLDAVRDDEARHARSFARRFCLTTVEKGVGCVNRILRHERSGKVAFGALTSRGGALWSQR